ncbi:glycoside hydrolase family 31 protein, partial [Streptococcus pneumoniae]|uniref:glycoside hydrolase family 31 protein n=1 Tax=Streptococcus pneumoniae TaxID=1313 RepID=UPI001EFE1336
AGMFNPYASAHGEGDHTLYKTHKEQVDQFRQALERRYRLLPYLYSLHHEAHITGVPMIRSLALETNVEAGTENIGDQWFVGPWMLVAPIVSGATAQVSDTARDI